jgi:hypothetical protein
MYTVHCGAVIEATLLGFKRQTFERLAPRDLDVVRWLWALTARNLDDAPRTQDGYRAGRGIPP